jgi:ribosomal protein S18 acetylase RimI-like enzyme
VTARIRRYTAADFAGVDALWRAVFPDDPPWNRAESAIPAKLAVQPELFLVAEADGAVVGTVMGGYDGHRGWVYAVAVLPSHRRLGIGASLMSAVESRLAALGCGKLNLQLRVGNHEAEAFYRRLGFEVEQRVSMGKRLEVERER